MDLRPFMERWHMLPPSGGVMLVAVSGGRDSVCLLHYLAAMPRISLWRRPIWTTASGPRQAGTWPLSGSCAGSLTFP